MLWSNFLHIYQPYNQQLDILERIVNESYRPLLTGFKKNKKAKVTLNINGGLVELLVKNGYTDVIEDIRILAERGQLEFTASAMYHPFLPLLPDKEVKRQIELNSQTNKKYFGEIYQPKGFFSPEMAYSHKLAQIVAEIGYEWIIAEELASPQKPTFTQVYSVQDIPTLKMLFRDKRISVLILSAVVRSSKSLLAEIGNIEIKKDRYLLTVMDGETFGHHRPGLEKVLFEFYNEMPFKNVLVSDLVKKFSVEKSIKPQACTWSAEEQDFWLEKEKKRVKSTPFLLWQDPNNPIHKLQWEFTYFVIDLVNNLDKNKPYYKKVRELLDKALQSDQFWWASAKPWWSLEMIEQGAYQLKEVVGLIQDVSEEIKRKTEKYYQDILTLAFDWQRQGKIRQAYRKKYRTDQQNKPYKYRVYSSTFNSIILEFEDEMKKAIANQEFEKAIKWRDAIYKLKAGTDIYDVLHVIDDLQVSRKLPSLKTFWEYSPKEFSEFAKKHFEDFNIEKFKKEQPGKLWEFLKKSFNDYLIGKSFGEAPRPLGFSWDERDNFYLCEMPGQGIKFILGSEGWNSFGEMKFDQPGEYHQLGQNFYHYNGKKVKIILDKDSLLSKIFSLVKKYDSNQGQYLKLAVLPESLGWAPVVFKRQDKKIVAEIPYEPGMGFKFKIFGFSKNRKKKKYGLRLFIIEILGKLDLCIRKMIWFIQG